MEGVIDRYSSSLTELDEEEIQERLDRSEELADAVFLPSYDSNRYLSRYKEALQDLAYQFDMERRDEEYYWGRQYRSPSTSGSIPKNVEVTIPHRPRISQEAVINNMFENLHSKDKK